MRLNVEVILSLLATIFAGILFLLMLNETRAIAAGHDPLTDDVHGVSRRFPRATFALAVVMGLVLGHLFWP
jgi:hypothetical protein